MSKQLRFALLDLVWSHDLTAMCGAYRKFESADQLTAHEREVVATLFNSLVHVWAVAARASNQECKRVCG